MAEQDNTERMYDVSHGVWKLIDSLTLEQTKSLESLIMAISMMDPNTTSSYYDGFIDGVMFKKFDICPTCHVQHEESDKEPFKTAVAEKMKALLASGKIDFVPESQTGNVPTGTYL